MTTRILLAGVLGGIAMFIWSSIAHMFLPLGEIGIREMPNQTAVMTAMHTNIGEAPGLYIFPGLGLGSNATREEKHEAMKHAGERLLQNPSGILMYHPAGRQMAMGRWLTVEFITELIEAILAVALLAQTRLITFGGRVGFVFVAGILAAIATNVSYWNWYGFPTNYTLSYMVIQVVGFLCTGIVAALVLKKNTHATG